MIKITLHNRLYSAVLSVCAFLMATLSTSIAHAQFNIPGPQAPVDDVEFYTSGRTDSYTFGGSGGGDTLGDAITSFTSNLSNFPTLATTLAYILGVGFLMYSLPKFKQHADSPTQIPLSDPVRYIGASAFFMAMPSIANVAINTFGLSEAESLKFSDDLGSAATSSSAGLDTMFLNLTSDVVGPMMSMLSMFSFVAAFFILLVGINRITKGFNEGARGPVGAGTAMHFVVAAVLFSLPDMIGVMSETIFGNNTVFVNATIEGDFGDDALKDRAEAVFDAIISFMVVVGVISFIRGWFVLKSVTDGNGQASMMAAFTHIIAGVLAVNIGTVYECDPSYFQSWWIWYILWVEKILFG